ncbi:unnamed protein product [Camellia sinensis]
MVSIANGGGCGGGGSGGSCGCGCCCTHNGAKVEEIQPHPVMEQLPGIQYCINSPPPWIEALVLGFQHYIMTLGTTVLIPTMFVNQMGGGNVEKAKRFEQIMRGMQGALIVTSCVQMLISFLGLWRNVVRFLTPLSMVPLITFTGLGFCYLGFPMLAKCVEVGLPELILMAIFSQYLPHYVKTKRRICDRFSVLFSISCVWAYAQILTSSGAYNKASFDTQASCRTDHAGLISGAPWIHIPYPFQWGRPTFNAGEAFAMMVASIVASIESTSTFLATARYGSATPVPASILSRGVGWLGFGTLLVGVFGSVTGPTASVENAGLLALTRIGSRRVIQISAGFMIFFSIIGEFQLSSGASPVHTHPRWFNDIVTVIFTSHATVAALVAMLLDCTLSREDDVARKDSGSQWWEKFIFYNADVRSDDFYKLPCKLNKLFPPL